MKETLSSDDGTPARELLNENSGAEKGESGLVEKPGWVALDVESLHVSDIINPDDLYYAQNPEHFWIDGIISEDLPHVTLLFGLEEKGYAYQHYILEALSDLSLDAVTIEGVSYFPANHEDESYFCLVAKIAQDEALLAANARLRELPHTTRFREYNPHLTLAYIKDDPNKRDAYIALLNQRFAGQKVAVQGINYGDE